jgi:hypothetical protein
LSEDPIVLFRNHDENMQSCQGAMIEVIFKLASCAVYSWSLFAAASKICGIPHRTLHDWVSYPLLLLSIIASCSPIISNGSAIPVSVLLSVERFLESDGSYLSKCSHFIKDNK